MLSQLQVPGTGAASARNVALAAAEVRPSSFEAFAPFLGLQIRSVV